MTYYSRQPRMPMPRQRFGPPPMARQPFGLPSQSRFQQSGMPYYPYPTQEPFNNGVGQQPYYPQQMPNQGYGGLSQNLNTIMGHVGTITNGVNMMRQVGSLMSLFRL